MSAKPVTIVRTIAGLRAQVAAWRAAGDRVALIPTMGALHAGHLSLVALGRERAERTVASIFVNPTQFAPHEDFEAYPREEAKDAERLSEAGCDLLFAPSVEEMYAPGFSTTVTVAGVSGPMDGAARPHHFAGVATVVAKLFHIVQPHRAYFGQKDAAQLAVLRQMVRDLHFDLEVISCPIVRDADGLALSSRNRYLSPVERRQALALHRALQRIQQSIATGERRSERLLQQGTQEMDTVKVDYLAAVDAQTLLPVDRVEPGTLIAVAAWIGSTRLIDNFLTDLASTTTPELPSAPR